MRRSGKAKIHLLWAALVVLGVLSPAIEAAKYKASKSSVRTISKRLQHYFPEAASLLVKRLARQIAEGKYNNFYFVNIASDITAGISHRLAEYHLPDGLKTLQLPEDMHGCQSAIVLRRYYTHFLEYDCRIADETAQDGTAQSVRLINIFDLQSGESVAYQPIELLKKIASKRYRKDRAATGHIVQFVADSYHISDYSWEMFNVITYNLVRYLFANENLETTAGTHMLADIERIAARANLPIYLLADFLKIERLAKLYIHNVHLGEELDVIDQELRNNLDRVVYTIAEVWRENLDNKQKNIPSTNNMIAVLHNSLIQHAENIQQSSD